MKGQEMMDFAPGEQEAVARAACDSSKMLLALRNARRRWWKNVLACVAILLLWIVYYGCLMNYLMDWGISWTFGMKLHISWEVYWFGRLSGVLVGFLVYGSVHHQWCLEIGRRIKIGRVKIPSKLATMTAMVVGLWCLVALVIHAQPLPDGTKWREVFWVIDLTGFVLVLLGYFVTAFCLEATTISRERLIKEEKCALGIFD